MVGTAHANVEYTARLKEKLGAESLALLGPVTDSIRNIVGEKAGAAQIVWDAGEDSNGAIFYVLRLTTKEGEAAAPFSRNELSPDRWHSLDYRLHSLYGEILRNYSHKLQKEKISIGS
jgi:hypothetical protein